MMMQCPRCSTRWRVAAASPVENPLFKCGRCHHLFRQFPGAPAAAPETASGASRRAAPPAEPDTLEFIFPERQAPEVLLPQEGAVVTPLAAAAAVASLDTPTAVLAPPPPAVVLAASAPAPERTEMVAVDEVDDRFASASRRLAAASDAFIEASDALDELALDIDDDDENDEELLADDVLAEPADDDGPILGDIDEDDEDDDEIEASAVAVASQARRRVRVEEETMRAPSGFGTIVRALGVAVSGFAALAMVVRVAPEQTMAWLAQLPVAGAGFAHDHNLSRKVELRNVQGRFQRLRNARRVFVISGDARNNSPLTIERIEVAGALYGLGGGEVDQKVVTTGNRTALTDLSEAEIVLLQRLDPAIALAPGETTPFLIVFLEPPRDLREFSSRVLTVRPTRRASSHQAQGPVG